MIIECPNCETRYDLKAELPPEGRTVRCAKCGQVWRAGPNDIAVEVDSTDTSAQIAPQQDQAYSNSHQNQNDEDYNFERAMRAAAQAASEVPTPLNSNNGGGQMGGDDSEDDEQLAPFPARLAVKPPVQNQPSVDKVRWFGSFRRASGKSKNDLPSVAEVAQMPAEIGDEQDLDRVIIGGETHSSHPQHQQAGAISYEELLTVEATREAVRSVFAALNDARNEKEVGHYPSHEHTNADAANNGHWSSASLFSGETASNQTGYHGGETAHAYAGGYSQHTAAPSQYAHQQAHEGHNQAYSQAHYQTDYNAEEGAYGHTVINPDQETGAQQNLEDQIQESQSGEGSRTWPHYPGNKFASKPGEEGEKDPLSGGAEGETDYDNRLYRQLEESQGGEYSEQQAGSKLAAISAWGLFLTVALGLILSVFGFRDMMVSFLPGITPVYDALGLPVTHKPLIFENVQYRWSLTDEKPTLIISGNVINRSQRGVNLPSLYITVKDTNPELDRELMTDLQIENSKIKAGQQAGFEIQLVSPSPSMTAVELELRDIQ